MGIARKKGKTPVTTDIEKMILYRKEGLTYQDIAKKVDFHYCTVYKFTKDISQEERNTKHKWKTIIKLLKEERTIKEIAILAKTGEEYVRKVRRNERKKTKAVNVVKEEKEIKNIEEEVNAMKNDRQKEVEKINAEIRRQKEKEEKEWQKQLKEERKYYKEKYSYVSK